MRAKGDRNTKFFYCMTNHYSMVNYLEELCINGKE